MKQAFFTYYGPEEDAAEAARLAAEAEATKNTEKKFTQEQVDKIISERLKKTKTEQEKTVKELEALKKNINLSAEEKSSLQSRIDDLQSSLMTKEELTAKEKKELETKFTKDLEKKTTEVETWRDRYTNSVIERALMDAAIENKAVRPQQIVELIRNKTRLVEERDGEGKPTGNFVPQTKFTGRGEDGKPVTLDLPVGEAVKQMKSITDEFGNLFLSDATGGIGGVTLTPGGNKGVDLKNTATYIEQRKKGLKLEQVHGS